MKSNIRLALRAGVPGGDSPRIETLSDGTRFKTVDGVSWGAGSLSNGLHGRGLHSSSSQLTLSHFCYPKHALDPPPIHPLNTPSKP